MQLVYSGSIPDDAITDPRTEVTELKQQLGEARRLIAELRDQIQDLELDLTLCQPRIERPFDRMRSIRLRHHNH